MVNGRDERTPSNTVGEILKSKEQRQNNDVIIKEQEKEYKKALNSMADTEYGKLVFKILIGASGVFEPVNTGDAKSLLRANDRNVYLKFIRPYLEPELRKELER